MHVAPNRSDFAGCSKGWRGETLSCGTQDGSGAATGPGFGWRLRAAVGRNPWRRFHGTAAMRPA